MYFKKLEITGFKSFLEKTTLHFEPGITAVVGPNGCGKSNIFDSIRWVLGEQSVKALRGSQMEDVIFNGTDTRESLGMAEVTLTFDNSNKFFTFDHAEVAVTRRIFRSGDSEYLLNKTPVRLKDIIDLLSGTGIGAESYSLVEQGKIDLVLSARPEDRRLVFDEASGITKYKSQKREALRKLEETEQNLLRVNDIIAEVKRSIGSLERQANKARRYKEAFEELKSKDISLALLQKGNLEAQKEERAGELKRLKGQEDALLAALKEEEFKLSDSHAEIKAMEENIMEARNQIFGLDNLISRNTELIVLNKERIIELEKAGKYLEAQIEQTKNKIALDEGRIEGLKEEYRVIKLEIEGKAGLLQERESALAAISLSTKTALENIAQDKGYILGLAAELANCKNEVTDLISRKQIYLARGKRLEIEKARVEEEKALIENNLNSLSQELGRMEKAFTEVSSKLSGVKYEAEKENLALQQLAAQIDNAEKQKLALQSQKEFLDELRIKYEDINESLNAVVYLDRLPAERMAGLVVKIKDYLHPDQDDKAPFASGFKLSGEAKPIDIDTQKITSHIQRMEEDIIVMKDAKLTKETRIAGLDRDTQIMQQDMRNQELSLANKKTQQQGILAQFNRIKEEEGIIINELTDLQDELLALEEKLGRCQLRLSGLEQEEKKAQERVSCEQDKIDANAELKEKALIIITQTRTELEALNRRVGSEEEARRILEDTHAQDKDALSNLSRQMRENEGRRASLDLEVKDLEGKIEKAKEDIQDKKLRVLDTEKRFKDISGITDEAQAKLDAGRNQLGALKNAVHEFQMGDKDIDFKLLSIREKILQAYKVDLDGGEFIAQAQEEGLLRQDIERLKERVDSYGNVNLVAIEEYDELKKRYDFLTQQQNDLICAKDALREAIAKINRTTKKMFLETFERVRQEFRNYFRLLFNGGDAQIFLIDEQDPLESGIEIICRPPGKKLQNVLLLSGGEKSMSAIALIFAIFKVKPAPFCVLDEIDAALDEANVERFGRILQEFVKDSQFIVITHNKRTIANAGLMYGITMQESGVSKIVSVKFAQDKRLMDEDPQVAAAAVA